MTKYISMASHISSLCSLCRVVPKVIEASDVILEILDARDPMGCRCAQLEEAVLKHEGKKRLLFVLNKIGMEPVHCSDILLYFSN